ncbi:RNA polymerase factor sigma-54 [Bacillus sp. FSL K6-3431]|uniref:RNA polymerase factor sigma-54 n=1 Tax=Bacillus sp. FSL K6-3431 TaxID=2921500 RepID=UPI0030F80A3A
MEIGLVQRQTLNVTMTQKLQQAISILQYSTQELTSFLEMKAMENPLINIESSAVEPVDTRDTIVSRKTTNIESDRNKWLEQIANSSENLADYLLSQLIMEALSIIEINIAKRLIYNLDMNGYLTISLEDVAAITNANQDEAEKCLHLIQSLDPPGIAARTLQECLLLQVERKKDMPKLVTTLLTNFFKDFAEREWKYISSKLSVSLTDIQKAADLIRKLNPRPGSQFISEQPQYVVPDLILKISKGKMKLELCEKGMPTITYQADYYSKMISRGDRQVNRFLNEKKQDYYWILNSLEQRRITLMKVGTAILQAQNDFFLKGLRFLRPLTMKELARSIDMHESTVSRVVRGKYIQTPSGMFELRMFFSQALQTNDNRGGDVASAIQAKTMIEELVQKENKSKPLSDQKIVEELSKKGMELSRRTVAKYREQLGILSSTKRKRYA